MESCILASWRGCLGFSFAGRGFCFNVYGVYRKMRQPLNFLEHGAVKSNPGMYVLCRGASFTVCKEQHCTRPMPVKVC